MFVAGLILLIVAVLLVVAAVFGGGASTTLDLGSLGHVTASVTAVFFLGMATLLVLALSLGFFRSGARRARARRADRRKVSELSTKLDAYKREEREQTTQRDEG